jgi:hypothetical protein
MYQRKMQVLGSKLDYLDAQFAGSEEGKIQAGILTVPTLSGCLMLSA